MVPNSHRYTDCICESVAYTIRHCIANTTLVGFAGKVGDDVYALLSESQRKENFRATPPFRRVFYALHSMRKAVHSTGAKETQRSPREILATDGMKERFFFGTLIR